MSQHGSPFFTIMIRHLWKLLLLTLIFTSCSDEDEWSNNVIIYVKQVTSSSSITSGGVVVYQIDAMTFESTLKELTVTSVDRVAGVEQIGTKTMSGSDCTVYFDYTAPEYAESSVSVSLIFEVSDTLGNTDSYTATITVYNSYNPLTELSNLTFYGALSGQANGYNFASNTWLDSATADDSLVDIYDVAPDSGEDLSCEWRSKTGLKFGRLTGFDYSSATNTSVAQGWALAIKLDKITDLKNDDIIFVGTDENTALAAIKINNIYDDAGVNNDRYNISIKRVN